MPEPHQPGFLGELQHLHEQPGQLFEVPLAELGDGAEIRRIESRDHLEVGALDERLGDAPGGIDALASPVSSSATISRRSNGGWPRRDLAGLSTESDYIVQKLLGCLTGLPESHYCSDAAKPGSNKRTASPI
jgi:hypothetical protein